MIRLGTVMSYLMKIQKLYESRATPLEFRCQQHFLTGNRQILLNQEILIQIPFRHIFSNSSNFSWVFKDCVNKHGHNFEYVSKMATPGLLKIKVLWKKGYDIIISVHHVTNKTLSRDSNYNVNVVKWPNFGSSSISVREVIITSIL